jgi:hypothetical protein
VAFLKCCVMCPGRVVIACNLYESDVDSLDLDDAVSLLMSWCDKYIRVARVVERF